jgi:hypothetical protein
MFDCLLEHGCDDLSSQIDPNQQTSVAIAGGAFGDIFRAKFYDGTDVAVKTLRPHIITEDAASKGLKVRVVYLLYLKRDPVCLSAGNA